MISIIIPARNEIFLEKTIRNVLENARGEIEILVVLDGYIPDPQIITNDDRVVFIHNKESIGQRQSINQAARQAKGEFIMKLDAHCAVDEGFDVKLAADCEYDWTVIPRMYNLDVATWTPKRHKRTDYMYIGINEKNELRSLYYNGDEYRKWHRREELIDDTMGCMGPCFFMHTKRFWELGGCDENHGSWGSQGIEVACKAWLSGGSLKVNKKTWFAHWFRGNIGFPYQISGKQVENARKYSEELWLNNKWSQQKRDFNWLLNKFNRPNESKEMDKNKRKELTTLFYKHIHNSQNEPTWRGVRVIKMPSDLIIYHQIIWENKPDYIIDIGTKFGGSALFFQDMLDMVGNGGQVITIDKFPSLSVEKVKNDKIIYLEGGSTSTEIIEKVKSLVSGSVMVVVDGDHRRQQVKREVEFYKDIVTSGQYMVLEDCYDRFGEPAGPAEARDWFMKHNKDFVNMKLEDRYLVGYCSGGWLRKK